MYSQSWQVLGNELQVAANTSNYTAIATAREGGTSVPYIIFTEGGVAKVKKYTAGSWQTVGGNVAANVSYTRIYIDKSNNLYVSYVDAANGNKLAVQTYNVTTTAWEPLNGDAANLYLSTTSVTNSLAQYSSTPRSGMAFDTANRPYIVFSDDAGLHPYVKRFNGTAWETLGAGPVSAERAIGVNIAIDSTSDIPYIVYSNQATPTATTGNLTMYRFIAGAWQSIPVPNPVARGTATTGATNAVRHSAITFNHSWNPVVSYFNAGNSNRTTVIIWNKITGTWSFSGTISSRDATNNSLTRDQLGSVYSSFTDAVANGSGRSLARVMKLPAGTTSWTELKNAAVAAGVDEPAGNLSLAIGEDSSRPYIIYTKAASNSVVTPVVQLFAYAPPPPPPPPDPVVTTPKQMEYLTRGVVAVRSSANQVYIGWRLLGTDVPSIGFNVYRDGMLLNSSPITSSTNYVDNTSVNGTYTVRAVINAAEGASSQPVPVWMQIYKTIPLQIPPAGATPAGEGYTYTANDCSAGDLDGDGEYEVVLKWDPTNSKDNAQTGYTGHTYLDGYKLDGNRLWRIDLGKNIRSGAHYTQFMVYDLDGDGKAEVACKTADGTIDGIGITIGDPVADYRNTSGYILSGPEYLTVFNGTTGAAMATTNYLPARGSVSAWGDNYGNRVDRFVNVVAYLDGARPSLVMGRGYYTRLVRVAWDWRNGQLTHRWTFDSNTPGNAAYAGQGNHNMTVGDVDGDGKDELCNGASAINDNGTGLYANGLGHGDALHMTDMDPTRPGQEVWQGHEDPGSYGQYGLEFRDAKTGQPIWGVPGNGADVGRAMTADIDPTRLGYEAWGSIGNLYDCKGVQIATAKPTVNFGIWWDGDLSRELLDGTRLDKWNHTANSLNRLLTIYNYGGADANNGTKANPGLTADLIGDWREEMIFRSFDNQNLLLFTTTIPTAERLYTLMHNPQYRVAIAWQNSAYNQPPYPDYYLGTGMTPPPQPNIYIPASPIPLPVQLVQFTAKENGGKVDLYWKTASEKDNELFTIERSKDGQVFTDILSVKGAGTTQIEQTYTATDPDPFTGISYYRLKQKDRDGKVSYSQIQKVTVAGRDIFIIQPNPVRNNVRLKFKSTTTRLRMIVTASDGRLILEKSSTLSGLENELNKILPSLPAGPYTVQIIDGTTIHTEKMLKQN